MVINSTTSTLQIYRIYICCHDNDSYVCLWLKFNSRHCYRTTSFLFRWFFPLFSGFFLAENCFIHIRIFILCFCMTCRLCNVLLDIYHRFCFFFLNILLEWNLTVRRRFFVNFIPRKCPITKLSCSRCFFFHGNCSYFIMSSSLRFARLIEISRKSIA